ncbi:hypothetical protein JG688_00004909 [Phytophthora aleatoria]|uniref:PH domain-containing protein n=1 Tax=Phytophthora aleatoria TaxID=2496075 RepID=A0A8J5JDJ3_9STRA|nr:hypothetical protein JG688_00004909 [Phytophthora aleatoria]
MRRLVLPALGALVTSFLFIQLQAQPPSTPASADLENPVPILTQDSLPLTNTLLDQILPSDPFNVSDVAQLFTQSPDLGAIGSAFEDAVVATFQFLKLWGTFLLLVSVPVVQAIAVLGEAALPHVLTAAKMAADYVSKMDPLHQVLVAFTVVFVAICIRQGYVHKARVQYVRTRRSLELRYRAFVASLSAKWRVVAILLPHFLFFALSYEALYWLPSSSMDVLSSEALFGLLSVGYPLVHSIGVIRQKRLYPKRTKARPGATSELMKKFEKISIPDYEWRAYEACLKYWVIWSLAVCVIGMVTLFLPAFVTSFFTVPLHFYNIFLIWMHSPFTRGDIALYTWLSPLVSPYANRIQEHEASVNPEAEEKTNFLIRMLVSLRVVPERHVNLAKDLWSQGPALFGLFFMFTPGFVASRGCSLMGFGFPAYVTIGVLGEKRTRRYEWWIAYFSVAVTVDYLITAIGREIGWLPLFYHVKLLVMMWLQFPYFQGAERIFNATMRGVPGGRSGSRHHVYSLPDTPSFQEASVYHGKMRTTPEGTAVDIVLGVSAETVHAITVHQNKMVFQSPVGVMKEIVWDYSEKSVRFVLDDGATSPTFVFPALTKLEAYFTAILALPDLEKPPQQIYIGVLIGQNLPSPIQQRRAIAGFNQPALLPMAKRRELLRSEQPVRNALSRERLGLEFIRSGFLCFTCSINTDLRGLTLGVHQLRVFPSPDCHDRSACLFSYAYEHLESCEVLGTRLELRFRSTHQLAKQPSFLVFQSLESQYIREAIWYLKNGTYMDASLRQLLASPRSCNAEQDPGTGGSHRASVLMFFADTDSLRQRIDACCRVIGCENLVECNDRSSSRQDEASASNVMINSGELSPMVLTNGLCVFHASCLSLPPSEALTRQKSRDKPPVPKLMQPLITLLQSTHYARTFKFQGQLLKRQNARTFHLRKTWHPKFVVLFETPVGGFLCYYDKITHCPGMTDTPKERRIIDLSSVLCIRPVSSSSPVSRSNANTPTMHAFDVVTLYRTWTFAAMEPEQYEIWLHVLTECVEKHATIASDKILRFPVKLAMTGQTCATEATSLEISSHGVSFCTGHEAEVVLSTWYYTDLEKWSVVFQQGYLCCLLKCRSPAPASPGSSRTSAGDTITQDFLFRTTEASTICLAIEFYVGKCMAKLEVLAGKFLEETRVHKSERELVADPAMTKRGSGIPKLELQMVREHPIETVSLAPVGSPEARKERPPLSADFPADSKPVPLPKDNKLSKIDEIEVATTAGTRYLTDPFVALNESPNSQPLIGREEPVQEDMQTNCNLPPTSSNGKDSDENKFSAEDAMVEISTVAASTIRPMQDDIDARHEVDMQPLVLSELPSSAAANDDMGEFESIDLEVAGVGTTDIQLESEPDGEDSTHTRGEQKKISPLLPAMCLNIEAIPLEQTMSRAVFMASDRAGISTKEASISTPYEDPASSPSGECIKTSTEPTPELVPPPPPLLLLTYILSWPGEPEDESVDEDKMEHPMPLEELEEDDRKSECDVSDRSDAFNSEETERKAMDVAYFESCAELQGYSEELRAFTTQAQRELVILWKDLQEKKYMYENKIANIHKKEELLNTFKVQHQAVKDATSSNGVKIKSKQQFELPLLLNAMNTNKLLRLLGVCYCVVQYEYPVQHLVRDWFLLSSNAMKTENSKLLSTLLDPALVTLSVFRGMFCLAKPMPKAHDDSVEDSDGGDQERVEEADTMTCYRLRRRVIVRFPCVLRVMEGIHQRVHKKQVIRAYVQVELCDGEDSDNRSTDAIRYRLWLPGSCLEQTLLLQESEIEASLPVELSWKHSTGRERRDVSRDIVRRYFQWDPNGGSGENGSVVAHLPCGSFWATEVVDIYKKPIGQTSSADQLETTEQQSLRPRAKHKSDGSTEVSVVSCTCMLDDRDAEIDDDDDDDGEETELQRKTYSYDTEELVHRGSYHVNGLYVVARVTMRAQVLRDLQPALASPTDRVRERDSFTIKFCVYHPASSGATMAEIHGHRDLREVVGPDKSALISSTSLDTLMRHIILTRLDAQVDHESSDRLEVAFLRDRLYAKQKATPVTKMFERDSGVNAVKLIDEARRHGIAGERGVKVLTTAKVVSGCGRTLFTVFDIAASHQFGQDQSFVRLRVDAYVCATSARLSLLLESSDLVHVVGDEDQELLLPIAHNDANTAEVAEMEEDRSRRLAIKVLDHLRVEQRSDGRGDRLVLSDFSFSMPHHDEAKTVRLFKTIRVVGHDQVLFSVYLDEGSEASSLSLRLELYDPASSSRWNGLDGLHAAAIALQRSDGHIQLEFAAEDAINLQPPRPSNARSDQIQSLESLRQESDTPNKKLTVDGDTDELLLIPPLMNICILIVGTRGDVQPFLAIALRLQEDGHRVRLATHTVYRDFVMSHGIEFYPLGGDPKELAAYMVKTGGHLIPTKIETLTKDVPRNREMINEIVLSTWPAVSEADPDGEGPGVPGPPFRAQAIIANPVSYGHVHVAERLGVPLHIMFPQPWVPTMAFPHPLSNLAYTGKWQKRNYLSYKLVDMIMWQGTEGVINEFRTEVLKLHPIRNGDSGSELLLDLSIPHSFMWSPQLVPKPSDWGDLYDVIGTVTLKGPASEYSPSPELEAFLGNDGGPIFVGFGSMSNLMTYGVVDTTLWHGGVQEVLTQFRAFIGLNKRCDLPDPLVRWEVPHIYLWNPALLPKPLDWGAELSVVGHVTLGTSDGLSRSKRKKREKEGIRLKWPSELAAFACQTPSPPVIYFGVSTRSMTRDDLDKLLQNIDAAAAAPEQKVRIIFQTREIGDKKRAPYQSANVFQVPSDLEYARFFHERNVVAAIHWGEPDITAEALSTGKPVGICGTHSLQHFMACVCEQARVGMPLIDWKTCTVKSLALNFAGLLKSELREIAKRLSTTFDREQPVNTAVKTFYANLPLEAMRCDVDPSKLARVFDPPHKLKLSLPVYVAIRDKTKVFVPYKPLRFGGSLPPTFFILGTPVKVSHQAKPSRQFDAVRQTLDLLEATGILLDSRTFSCSSIVSNPGSLVATPEQIEMFWSSVEEEAEVRKATAVAYERLVKKPQRATKREAIMRFFRFRKSTQRREAELLTSVE